MRHARRGSFSLSQIRWKILPEHRNIKHEADKAAPPDLPGGSALSASIDAVDEKKLWVKDRRNRL